MPTPHVDLAHALRLIVITDPVLAGPRGVVAVVEEALRAGVRAVQLRDKAASAGELLALARELRGITRTQSALFFVNDRLDVAIASEADGVHLGPDDIPVAAARATVPDGFLIGYSTDDPEVARAAESDGASYVGCGTVYPTTSKVEAGDVIGLKGLRSVVEAVRIPVVGIGGINPARAGDVYSTGAAGVAVISAVTGAEDVGAAVRQLLGSREGEG